MPADGKFIKQANNTHARCVRVSACAMCVFTYELCQILSKRSSFGQVPGGHVQSAKQAPFFPLQVTVAAAVSHWTIAVAVTVSSHSAVRSRRLCV